jgi:hypothetical protein
MKRPSARTAHALEIVLARLLADPGEVEAFLSDREGYCRAHELSAPDRAALKTMDAEQLRFSALCYARKRRAQRAPGGGH